MNSVVEDILMHYGMPRRSGRYPWGSGDEPYQRNRDFLSRVEELKKQGWTETAENIKKAAETESFEEAFIRIVKGAAK